MKIEIDISGVHRDEIEELKKYLEENCWKWQAPSPKPQASSAKPQASSYKFLADPTPSGGGI
jgi:hypothetical protein